MYHRLLELMTTKYCSGCDKVHQIDDFAFRDAAHTKRRTQCKKYLSKVRKERRFEYEDTKLCTGPCGEVKPIEDFWHSSKLTGKRDAQCSECRTGHEVSKIPENAAAARKNWYDNNGGKEVCKVYREKYKPIRNARNKERRETDIHYKLKELVRGRILDILRKNDIRRREKVKYLGMELALYKLWLEFQFSNQMTWDNYGTYWQIDHVLPCDLFDFKEEDDDAIFKCFNWKNTRPMIKVDNIAKSNKLDKHAVALQIIFIGMFSAEHNLDPRFDYGFHYLDYYNYDEVCEKVDTVGVYKLDTDCVYTLDFSD